MVGLQLLVSVLAGAIGALVPLLKELVKELRRKGKGDRFFQSSFGRAVLDMLGLNKAPDGPEMLFGELSEASKKMDAAVSRIQEYTKARESAVLNLETQLSQLMQQEGELRKKIEALQSVPLPVADYFASMVSKGEKSSAIRDYMLFAAGVVVSSIVGIVLKHFGLA